MKQIIFVFLFSLFSGMAPILAQDQFSARYNITYVTMENGLRHNFIDDIFKDSNGFLWISTGGSGLSRYDGYEFIHYDINTPGAKLKSNFIREVCEDDFGRLWIVSDGGVDIMDLNMRRMVMPKGCEAIFSTLSEAPSIDIMKDSRGCIWVFGNSSLYRISFDQDGHIAEIRSLLNASLSAYSIAMQDIDQDGHIWVGIENRVCKLYPEEDLLLKAVPVSPNLVFSSGTSVSVFRLKENEVWIGTNRGLVRYNKNENAVKTYEYDKNNNRSINQNFITDLAVTSEKQLLVSTLRGINIYNPLSDDFDHLYQDEGAGRQGLNSDFVNCMFIDRDIIWIGTEVGGLNRLVPWKLAAKIYAHHAEDKGSISRNLINSIFEDKDKNLWVGTVEGGLDFKKYDSESFLHYTTESAVRLSHNSVSAITADEYNRLWVGTWGNGLNIIYLDNDIHRVEKYVSSTTNPGTIHIDFVGSLCYDSHNKLMWIGTNYGIYYYDYETKQLLSPFPPETNEHIHGCIGVVIDRQKRLWMGCMDGVYIIDLNSRAGDMFQYIHLKYKLDESETRLIDRMSSFCEAHDGTLWVGSNGCGIYKHIPNEDGSVGTFVGYTTRDGLINNNVLGILEDHSGKLWISTNNGLSSFDPVTERFTNYTREDGLPGNQFYWNASCLSESGMLYFGGLDGLVMIDPNHVTTVPSRSDVTFTKLSIMNEEVYPGDKYIDRDIAVANKVKMHERDKSFSLEFSALDYESNATSAYYYRLSGFDDQWIEVSAARRFASYTNLPAGKYVFQVKYSPEGIFEEAGIASELEIVVTPFFYKTRWFILLMVLLLVIFVIYFYFRRIHILKKQRQQLAEKVEERTRELAGQKALLEKQTQELSRKNEVLTQQNEKITNQKTQLIKMSKKVKDMNMDKISFFTSITHEFRTPITLIIGPIERALKLSHNPKVMEQLRLVERNSKYLLSLVNQLMDFRKVESGNMEIVKSKGNFFEFFSLMLAPFEVFAAEREITISKYFRMDDPYFMFDSDAMRKIISNVLSNAVKFTPNKGCVSIYIATIKNRDDGQEQLFISIRDTGSGISDEDLNKIFNRFYQSNKNVKYPVYGQSGTGIGLYLCKQIVRQHGGEITVSNNKNGIGAGFRILMPVQREGSYDINPNRLAERQMTIAGERTEQPEHFLPGRKTILVVEDNSDMREYIRSILSEHYNTLEAENGKEALVILSECNVDFIVSDLMMPEMDGLEFSRKVKENFHISHIPFLMLTAKTSPETRAESYRTGVDAYMMKPFSEDLLLSRISNIFENIKRYQRRFSVNMDVDSLQIEEESNDKKFLNKALDVIKENYKNPYYESGDFIESMGVSKSLLNKKLQDLTGQSIGQFIRNYRLNVARELLEKNKVTKNMNVSEIAYEVGFNDPKYFTRCFTKRFRTPPSNLMKDDC